MKKGNALFVYLNPEKHDSVEDSSGINMLHNEPISKMMFDSYNFISQLFVNGGEN